MQKLSSFFKKSFDKIQVDSQIALDNLVVNIQQQILAQQIKETDKPTRNQIKHNKQQQPLQGSRIKQIGRQKKRILDQLKKLDGQIAQLQQEKHISTSQQNQFIKKKKVTDDIQAAKQARQLVKQLHSQRKKLEERKKKNHQKQLMHRKNQQYQRQQQIKLMQQKLKQQKRLIIERRMQQQKQKRQQRIIIDKQSNQLIIQLKKDQQYEKQSSIIPNKIAQFQQKKKLLQKKTNFNIQQIQEHQKKYNQYKSKQKQLRRQKSQSIKAINHNQPKYGKSIWNQFIDQQSNRKKQQQKNRQINRKIQLQKRIKYGDIVKNIFMSKQRKKQNSLEKSHISQSQARSVNQNNKPYTPDQDIQLPQIAKTNQKQNTKTNQKQNQVIRLKERLLMPKKLQKSFSVVQKSKSRIIKEIRQKDPQLEQKLRLQKQREYQIRRQTKQRLQKLQNTTVEKAKPEKIKYENYLNQVKVKRKAPEEQWKIIMANQKLSKEQKYNQMMTKANTMENQAKLNQHIGKKSDHTVNLYIGSIQAKLALLQKF